MEVSVIRTCQPLSCVSKTLALSTNASMKVLKLPQTECLVLIGGWLKDVEINNVVVSYQLAASERDCCQSFEF